MKGPFITFEGGEGAGKTTLIDSLKSYLSEHGYSVICTREPGGSFLSEMIRKWVLEHNALQIAPMSELLLFLAARAQHIAELIAPALHQGKIVLCDRFNDSTIAYQGVARGLGTEKVSTLCEVVTKDCQPELTLYLDVDPAVGLNRSLRTHKDTSAAGNLDKIESEKASFHKSVREGFLMLATKFPERIKVIDANQEKHKVFDQALKHVETLLQSRKNV